MSKPNGTSSGRKKKILILGTGFSGVYTMQHLVRNLKNSDNAQITLVSEENFILFAPMLQDVATGGVNTRHIAYPIRMLKEREHFQFIQTRVKKIDLKNRQVNTSSGNMGYDYLVMALGGITDPTGYESAGVNKFTLKTLHDSMLIRNHIIEMFEQAAATDDIEEQKRLLTFVVSGAGYTGIQFVAQLVDFVRKDLSRIYGSIDRSFVKIVLLETQAKIIAEMHTKLGDYVMKYLKKRNVDVRLKSKITGSTDKGIRINNNYDLATNTVIWVTGVVAAPPIAALEAETDKTGRVFVDEYMEVPGFPGVYSVGDCTHFVDKNTGLVAPPRAHHAVRQAKVAAMNIIADIRGTGKKIDYRFSDAPEIVTLGVTSAVFRFRKLRIYGFAARLFWMLAYSMLMTGADKRTRIMMDWLLVLLFGRDTILLKDIKYKNGDNGLTK